MATGVCGQNRRGSGCCAAVIFFQNSNVVATDLLRTETQLAKVLANQDTNITVSLEDYTVIEEATNGKDVSVK